MAARPVGFAYGALSSGADIMWAEALLERGAELHVVLPFAREEFRRVSVEPAGPGWAERFERCMAAATTVRYATEDAFLGDDVLYRYGAELAMGLALLRARYLRAEVRQLAVWDGRPASGPTGTAVDLETWRGQGYAATVIAPPADPAPVQPASPRERSGRIVCALLFGDFKGFSQLIDEQFPSYTDHVLSALAQVLDRHGDAVLHRNTWGDAIYVALDDLGPPPNAPSRCRVRRRRSISRPPGCRRTSCCASAATSARSSIATIRSSGAATCSARTSPARPASSRSRRLGRSTSPTRSPPPRSRRSRRVRLRLRRPHAGGQGLRAAAHVPPAPPRGGGAGIAASGRYLLHGW